MEAEATFLISEPVGREVVYTATCFKDTYNITEDSHTIFEVSRVPQTLPPGVAPGIEEDTLNKIDAALDIVNGSLAIGSVMTPPPVNLVCGVLAAVGGLVQLGLNIFGKSKKPDPVEEKLKILAGKIKELDEKTKVHFADMKSFITDNQFSIEIVSEIATLKKYLNDVLTFFTEEAYENYKAAYELHSPLNIGYILISLLIQKSTNPLIMATESNTEKKDVSFQKWITIFEAVLGDLLFIKALSTGLLKGGDSHDYERLWKLRDEVFDFVREYKDARWKQFTDGFGDYLEKHTHLRNDQKSEEIRKMLEEMCPGDAFYICVVNEARNRGGFYCYCPNEASQLIQLRGKGKCEAFVYRSIKGNRMKQEEFDKVKEQVNALTSGKFDNDYDMEGHVKDYLVAKKLVRSDGFICMMTNLGEGKIRSANCPGHEWGPGWWNDIKQRDENWNKWQLIVGLP